MGGLDWEVFFLETVYFQFLSIILGAFLFLRTVLRLVQVSEGKTLEIVSHMTKSNMAEGRENGDKNTCT